LQRNFGRRLPAAAVAGVWLYHGLWCKLLGRCPDQVEVVAAVPGLRGTRAKAVLLGIGVVETALAVWVVSGRRPRVAAAGGTALVAGMNAGGLVFGRRHIPAVKTMLAENAAFLALAWLAAEQDARARES
jgi:DoxX-like family